MLFLFCIVMLLNIVVRAYIATASSESANVFPSFLQSTQPANHTKTAVARLVVHQLNGPGRPKRCDMGTNMGVSKNRGIPKSSILIGISIINHPFWGTPIFGNTHIRNEGRNPKVAYATRRFSLRTWMISHLPKTNQ